MASPKFDQDRAVRILLDAQDFGDATACERHRITLRTLERYRARLADDPKLSEAVALKKKELDEGWKRERLEALRAGIRKMGQLFAEAKLENLRDVTGGVKVLGELQVASEVLSEDEDAAAGHQGSELEETEGGTPGGEGSAVH